MTTKERQNVRQALLDAGFRKNYSDDKPEYYDKGDGACTERWKHFKDNTAITPARRPLKNRWMLSLLLVAATLAPRRLSLESAATATTFCGASKYSRVWVCRQSD
jgi:hypothetical protein